MVRKITERREAASALRMGRGRSVLLPKGGAAGCAALE